LGNSFGHVAQFHDFKEFLSGLLAYALFFAAL